MRGDDQQLQTGMFSYVALEDRIPADHPLRGVRKLVDAVLAEMSKDFDGVYSEVGRPSIAPERLLRALLLQVFYSVRSERLLMEQLSNSVCFSEVIRTLRKGIFNKLLGEIIRRFASLMGALLFELPLWASTWRSAIPRLNANFSLSQIRSDELEKPYVRKLILELMLGTFAICFLITSVTWILSNWVFSPSYVQDWRGYINKEVLLIGLFVIASGVVAALRIGFAAALMGSILAVSFGSSTTLVLGWIKNVERPDPIASGVTVEITLGTYAATGCVLAKSRAG